LQLWPRGPPGVSGFGPRPPTVGRAGASPLYVQILDWWRGSGGTHEPLPRQRAAAKHRYEPPPRGNAVL